MADTPPDYRAELARSLEDAGRAVSEARKFVRETHGRLLDVEDLRWLVGRLGNAAPDDVTLPPRLTGLVRECVEAYRNGGAARFTVAIPLARVRAVIEGS